MKKIVLSALFVLLFCSATFAMKNEPDGFRGIKWGDSAEKHKKILEEDVLHPELAKYQYGEIYRKVNENYRLGEAEISRVYYRFDSQGFFEASFNFTNENAKKVLAVCINQWGSPDEIEKHEEADFYYWYGKNVEVRLFDSRFKYFSPDCTIIHKASFSRIAAWSKEREKTESGKYKKDF